MLATVFDPVKLNSSRGDNFVDFEERILPVFDDLFFCAGMTDELLVACEDVEQLQVVLQ